MGNWDLGMGHGAWGIAHVPISEIGDTINLHLGIGHGALGMGHWALAIVEITNNQ
ncbi:MAG: hypothetical protein QQW96_04765 [Tychonema bourrellyi B0820]|nr:hypothetical protein [Tychonema bourrellyi B0820]